MKSSLTAIIESFLSLYKKGTLSKDTISGMHKIRDLNKKISPTKTKIFSVSGTRSTYDHIKDQVNLSNGHLQTGPLALNTLSHELGHKDDREINQKRYEKANQSLNRMKDNIGSPLGKLQDRLAVLQGEARADRESRKYVGNLTSEESWKFRSKNTLKNQAEELRPLFKYIQDRKNRHK